MSATSIVILHICGGTVGLLSGYLSMTLRKRSGWHAAAGNVFFVSMIVMSLSGAYVSLFIRPVMINVVAGLLTFYLVMTARRAATHRSATVGPFDGAAFVFVLAVGAAGIAFGVEAATTTGLKNGVPAAAYFVFGAVALLCAIADIRLFERGGVTGNARVVRHLWRMCLALLIATFSLYPGQARLFPMWLRQTNLLMLPHVFLIGSMIFHSIRMSKRRRVARNVERDSGTQPDLGPDPAVAA